LLVEDRDLKTSALNTVTATTADVARGFLSILQVGTGAAQGVKDIKKGLNGQGDALDIAIGALRLVADTGEIASTAVGAAGMMEKAAQATELAALKKMIRTKEAERTALAFLRGTASQPIDATQRLTVLSKRIAELHTAQEFRGAGYSFAGSLKRWPRNPINSIGKELREAYHLKRLPTNPLHVEQGIDTAFEDVRLTRSKQLVVEIKGRQMPLPTARHAFHLDKSKLTGLVEGSDAWNMNRLNQAAGSWNPLAKLFRFRLGKNVPESLLSVVRTESGPGGPIGETVISRLTGATGRPTATALLSGLDNVSPVGEMVLSSIYGTQARTAVQKSPIDLAALFVPSLDGPEQFPPPRVEFKARGLTAQPPSYAVGGITTRDHIAMVHKDEAIIPMSKMPHVIAKAVQEANGKQAGRAHLPEKRTLTVNVHGAGTPDQLRQHVIPLLRSELASVLEEMSAALTGGL
jgi:hypothetical protein